MALSRIFSPVLHFDDDRGNPLAGGWLCTYISNTDTPVATYKDPSGTLNDVEIELDGRGECEVWLDSSIVYKFVLWNADRTKWFWKKNYITAGASGGSPSPSINFNVVGDEATIDVQENEVEGFKVYVVSVKQTIINLINNKKTLQTPVADPSASGAGLEFIDSVTQDANGEITPHKKSVQDGTTAQKGVVKLSNAIDSTSVTEAATPKAVKDAYDELNNKIVARAVFLSQAEWAVQSQLPGDPAKVYYVENGTGEDAYTVYVWKESTSTYEEVDESSIDLDGYWHDGPTTTGNGNVVTNITLGNDGVPQIEKGMSAEPAFSVLPVSKGGTNADDEKEAAYNLFNGNVLNDNNTPSGDSILLFRLGTPTAGNGYFLTRKVSLLWSYIKDQISSVLGLSENGYTGKAATAGSADTASAAASGSTLETAINAKLDKTGDASNTTSTFTKASGDTSSMTSGSKLSVLFTAISSFFASVASALNGKADKANITGATKCKITYNGQGIVTSGADLGASDIPDLPASKITSGTFGEARIPTIWPDKMPFGRVFYAASTTGYKCVALIKPTSANNGDSLVSLDVYEFNANGTISYRGFINIGCRRDGTTYSYKAQYFGYQLANCSLVVRYSGNTHNTLVYVGKTNSAYCSVVVVPKRGGNYDGTFDYSNINLYNNPSTEDISPYYDVTITNTYIPSSTGNLAVANGVVGSPTIPVYVDSNGQVKVCDPSQMSVGNATKWDGHAISIGTVSSSAGTISIV